MDILSNAERPIIWAGGGINLSDANEELTRLAEALNAAVIVTAEGKGAIAENHPNYVGPYYYSHGPGHRVLPQSDAILAVGTRLHFFSPVSWSFKPDQPIIHVDAARRSWGGLAGGSRHLRRREARLQAMLDGLERRGNNSKWTAEEIAEHRALDYQDTTEKAPNQVRIIESIRAELDDDAVLISGISSIGYWSHLAFPVLAPRSYLNTSYFATLGYAFPTGLGAKVGNPDRQVVVVTGDGGFMYALPDLATAVQEGINTVTVVFNDGALGASLRDQQVRYKGRVIGTQLRNPDFAATAQAFGAVGVTLDHYDKLGAALADALKLDKPVIIDLPIESWTPPFQIAPPGTIQ